VKAPAILFVVGASGVGKTTAVRALEARGLRGVHCYYFDDVRLPSNEEVEREYGNWERWQADATRKWIERLTVNADRAEIAVIEGQTRPIFVQAAFMAGGVATSSRIVLLNCQTHARKTRLEGRGQPDLVSPQMESWSAYLYGQSEALMLPILDTSELGIEAVAAFLERQIESLRPMR
jgi:dephospho-CoA kinase